VKKNYNESESGAALETATFAGGCFWCVEAAFTLMPGVISVTSGYAGGKEKNPTYEAVVRGQTGHREAVHIVFDPKKTSYETLLDFFWKQINPTDAEGQFVDRGKQYSSAIFYHTPLQKKVAELSKKKIAASKKFETIATEIIPFTTFYEAESYHQNYHEKNQIQYLRYKRGSGREQILKKIWGELPIIKTPDDDIKKKLTPMQYRVTQECSTEPAFENAYWNNKEEGIYVDIVSGEALFSSQDKFDSGTGWPSFNKPLEKKNIIELIDNSQFMKRTQVRSAGGDSHLGHVFDDGPKPSGKRYCMNSAALRFIPVKDLEKEGYGKYKKLFK